MKQHIQSSLEEAFLNEDDLQAYAVQIAQDISKGDKDIVQLIESLGFALTSNDVHVRVSGTKVLSIVLRKLPVDFLNEKQLDIIVQFYIDRLKDHHNVIPTVIDGLSVLVEMKNLSKEKVPLILSQFFNTIEVQSQTRSDRENIFHFYKYVSEHYDKELKAMKGDFVFGIIGALDGERDPRNLDFIFSFMPDFIAHYPLLHLSEEMFEVFACYFPVNFYPSKTDPHAITRDSLAEKLKHCLTASQDFLELTISLALEKLESDLVEAKLDSLAVLKEAAEKFSVESLEPYVIQIWNSLKSETFPGTDNEQLKSAALNVLYTILEKASSNENVSHNHQTSVLGTFMLHLTDITNHLFEPATALALVCVSTDPKFASDKILEIFCKKLKSSSPPIEPLSDDQRQRVYKILAQIYKLSGKQMPLEQCINVEISNEIHTDVITMLRKRFVDENVNEKHEVNLELNISALELLKESVPMLCEVNRALLYKVLTQFTFEEKFNIDFTMLLECLAALYPVEVQSNCIDIWIQNFPLLSNFIKAKIYTNVLPLLKQLAFTERILDLILTNVFRDDVGYSNEVRLLALKAFNTLMKQENQQFIEHLQTENSLIDKFIKLIRSNLQPELDVENMKQISEALSAIVQELAIAEQYAIVTEYLPQLNLQNSSDLFIAKGLISHLHKDISLDDHFEHLIDNLIKISITNEDEHLREVAHHLLCSLMNKYEDTPDNKTVVHKVIAKLKEDIQKGDKKAVEVLAWLGKGLVVRGFDEAGEIVEALADLLDHSSLATAATLAFDIISAEFPQLHLPIVKLLYKQKFFQMILKKFEKKLEQFCEHHLNAFIFVLKETPHIILKMYIEKIGPILLKSLEDKKNTRVILISLNICENFIRHRDEYFCKHLKQIIPILCELSKFKESMIVRIKALQLLTEITNYSKHDLLPFKMDIILALGKALDDSKRIVRKEAVIARNLWYLIDATE